MYINEIDKVNQQLTLALEVANMGIWDWDLLTNQIIWSSGYDRLFGLAPRIFPETYEALMACIHPDDVEAVALGLNQAYLEHRDFLGEFRVVWSDGSIHWIESKAKAFYNSEGQAVRMLGTAVEIYNRKAREEQLHLLESVFVHANDAVLIAKTESHEPLQNSIVYANPAFCQMTGYTLEEILNQTLYLLLDDKTNLGARQKIHTAMQNSQPSQVDLIIYSKNGKEFWVEFSLVPITNETNLTWVGILRDITERKQVEIAFKQSEERLMIKLTQQICQSLDLKTILDTAVSEVQKLLTSDRVLVYQLQSHSTGIIVAELMRCRFTEILDKAFSLSVFPQQAQQGFLEGRIYTITDRDQEEMLVSWLDFLAEIQVQAMLAVPIIQQNTLWGLLIVHQCAEPREWLSSEIDLLKQLSNQMAIAIQQSELYQKLEEELHERKRVEVALRESETLFRSLCEFAPVGIFKADVHGKNTYSNPCCQEITGCTFEEALGDGWMESIHPEDLQVILPQWNASIAANQEFGCEVRHVYRNGTVRCSRMKSVPIFSELGEPIGHVGTVEDITEIRAIEQMKHEFISIVSHELRTPLASIRGALGLLAAGIFQDQPETAQQMLDIAKNDTERLVRLVNDILDLERLETKNVTLEKQWYDASTLMQQSVESLQSLAVQNNITLSILPTFVQVWADPDWIVQTLVNLVSNAIKFSPAQTTVTLSVEDVSDYILFKVQDQGRGIPDNQLEAIFGRFQQVDISDSRQKGGTGLGLAICRGIIEQHGGRIWAKSILGQGSIFYFTLPKPRGV